MNFSKKTPLVYLKCDIETKQDLIKLASSNLLYDGSNLTIIIKEAFQPIVEIAFLINGGLLGTKLTLCSLLKNPRTSEIRSRQEKIALEFSFSKNGGGLVYNLRTFLIQTETSRTLESVRSNKKDRFISVVY